MMNVKEIEKLIKDGYIVEKVNVNARRIDDDDGYSSYPRAGRRHVQRLNIVSVELISKKGESIIFECTYEDMNTVAKDLVGIGTALTKEE